MNNWSESEYTALMKAIETGQSLPTLILDVHQQTGRSQKAIERKLCKIGFLRKNNETYRTKLGHVR